MKFNQINQILSDLNQSKNLLQKSNEAIVNNSTNLNSNSRQLRVTINRSESARDPNQKRFYSTLIICPNENKTNPKDSKLNFLQNDSQINSVKKILVY